MFDAATNLIGLFFETAIFDTANIQQQQSIKTRLNFGTTHSLNQRRNS